MDCKEFKELQKKYSNGSLSDTEAEKLQAHLAECRTCQNHFDQVTEEQSDLDDKKQNKIIRKAKYKSRLANAVFILLLLIVLQIGGSFLSSFYFNIGDENSRLYRTQKTAGLMIDLAFPNVSMPIALPPMSTTFSKAGWGHSSVEIKPYFMAQGHYALEKTIGKEKEIVGHLSLNQFFSGVLSEWEWADGSYRNLLYFIHPRQENQSLGSIYDSPDVWETLQIMPDGTVAEMAISFTDTYTIANVRELLGDYDLDITWYAVSTGLENESENNRDPEHQEPLTAFRGAWGIPSESRQMLRSLGDITLTETVITHSETSGSSVTTTTGFRIDSPLLERYFLESLTFLKDNEDLTKKVWRGSTDTLRISERHEYIIQNGINVYGVVITGPVKELLRLEDAPFITAPALGEIRLWNWFNRSFTGELY